MTAEDLSNRSFNLMVTALVLISGLGFGTAIFTEPEFNDKIDDFVVLGSGLLILVWYLVGRNRYRRSIVPTVFVVLSLGGKLYSVVERDDRAAFPDDLPGIVIFLGIFAFALYQYLRAGRVATP